MNSAVLPLMLSELSWLVMLSILVVDSATVCSVVL